MKSKILIFKDINDHVFPVNPNFICETLIINNSHRNFIVRYINPEYIKDVKKIILVSEIETHAFFIMWEQLQTPPKIFVPPSLLEEIKPLLKNVVSISSIFIV